MRHASAKGSFDGGDQGFLLNEYFSNWSTLEPVHRIPFIYNVTFSLHYSYRPAFRRFSENVKAVHFIGPYKPWMGCDNASAGANAWAGELGQYVQLWCKFYREAGVQFVDCPGPLQFAAGVGDKGCEVFERDFQDYKVQWSSKVDELMKVGGGGGAGIEGVGLRKMPFVMGQEEQWVTQMLLLATFLLKLIPQMLLLTTFLLKLHLHTLYLQPKATKPKHFSISFSAFSTSTGMEFTLKKIIHSQTLPCSHKENKLTLSLAKTQAFSLVEMNIMLVLGWTK